MLRSAPLMSLSTKERGGAGRATSSFTKPKRLMTWAPIGPLPTRSSPCRSTTSKTSLAALPPSAADTALTYGTSAYVPSPMDYGALQSQLVVLGVVGVMTAYWW